MASARILLSLLGVGIAVAGIVAARFGLDPFIALALVVVGRGACTECSDSLRLTQKRRTSS